MRQEISNPLSIRWRIFGAERKKADEESRDGLARHTRINASSLESLRSLSRAEEKGQDLC